MTNKALKKESQNSKKESRKLPEELKPQPNESRKEKALRTSRYFVEHWAEATGQIGK